MTDMHNNLDLAAAVEKASPSTVLVNARKRLPASGVAIAADLILTSSHVVERDEDITVLFASGSPQPASLVGRDPASDLALLRLPDSGAVPAQTAAAEARVGQLVLALGHPTTEGIQASLGIVSAIGGAVRTGRAGLLERYLRTDAIPYPGFSGGPLIDLAGNVLGINTSGFTPGSSLTIPAALAWRIAETLRAQGRIPRGYLGVRTQPVELSAALQSQLNRKQPSALMIVGIEAGGSAEKAGLIIGDILAGANGAPVPDHDALLVALGSEMVGKTLTLEVLRGGELRALPVVVGERA